MNPENQTSRRAFVRKMAALGGGTMGAIPLVHARMPGHPGDLSAEFNDHLSFPEERSSYEPLDHLKINSSRNGILKVCDSQFRFYHEEAIASQTEVQVCGEMGTHLALLVDDSGRLLDMLSFRVGCRTGITCEDKQYEALFDILHWIIVREFTEQKYGDRIYHMGVGWFQDNVHLMKGLKYFRSKQQDFMDLFAGGQFENGMIPDFFRDSSSERSYYTQRFTEMCINGDSNRAGFFVKVPVENMSEFHFLEGLYHVWKATGDHEWMKGKLDQALRTVDYELTSPSTWSDRYQLIKRSYTIDIWDFLPDEEAERLDHNIMANDPARSRYGILYADNIGMAIGCQYLAEMLEYAGRNSEAGRIRKTGEDLRKRTNDLCWNGHFFTHRIPEDAGEHFDFGDTDTAAQVTLSNAYALNKGTAHEQCVQIINTYQRIRREMPASSPGEWYMCYPPYEKGWHMDQWEYMNGGVSPIVAGELAHGAFEHGFETYAVDILQRVYELVRSHGNHLHCIYRGAMPEVPEQAFRPVELTPYANAGLAGPAREEHPVWVNQEGDDLGDFPTGIQEFGHVRFHVVNPDENRGKACIGLSGDRGYADRISIQADRKAGSVYFLHALHDPCFTISHSAVPKGRYYGGYFRLRYADGTSHIQHITNDQVGFFHFPVNVNDDEWPRYNSSPVSRVAWRGSNSRCNDMGLYITGFNHPFPEKEISQIELQGAGTPMKWMIVGITLSDQPVFMMPGPVSFGAPDNWAAAAVMYAMVEGLAGVKDTGVAFNRATISPRWEAARVSWARAVIKYEDSQGYMAYRYRIDKHERTIHLTFTGTSTETDIRLLLPDQAGVGRVLVNGTAAGFTVERIEGSGYVNLKLSGGGVQNVVCELR
ncbi:MAG: hypothetical protein V2B15_05600 [Bacteroidota bacterium]